MGLAIDPSAVLRALEARRPLVLIHSIATRGVSGPPVGQITTWTTDGGLRKSLGSAELDTAVARAAAEALESGQATSVFLTPVGELATRRDPAYLQWFLEPVLPKATLIIVGAGHVAQPLAVFAHELDFAVTVIDDRADFANRERFPTADAVKAAPISTALNELTIDHDTYVVLVTRAHRFDEEALRRIVRSPAPYVGMIGSRRRVHLVYQTLRDEGIPAEAFQKLYAPIGLDIGARTPVEIALAVAAELVNVRRRGRAPHLSLAIFRDMETRATSASHSAAKDPDRRS